jgi:hypothetical protein
LLLSLAGIGWGFGFPTGKIALQALAWPHVVTLRLGLAALIALPYALASAEGRRVLRADRWAWLAGSLNWLGYIVQYAGLARLTVSLSAVLVGLLPALIAAASILWGEKVSSAGWLGVAAASAGAAIIGAGAGARRRIGVGRAAFPSARGAGPSRRLRRSARRRASGWEWVQPAFPGHRCRPLCASAGMRLVWHPCLDGNSARAHGGNGKVARENCSSEGEWRERWPPAQNGLS